MKEIDGGLTHVLWKETVIPIPHFTDNVSNRNCNAIVTSTKSLVTCFMFSLLHQQNGPVLRPSYSVYRPASPSQKASLSGDRDLRAQPQKTEAERDDSLSKVQPSLSKNYSSSCSVTGHAEGRMESTNKDGGLIESTGDSTTVWSSVELDMNYGQSAKCLNCDWNGCAVLCCILGNHSQVERTQAQLKINK